MVTPQEYRNKNLDILAIAYPKGTKEAFDVADWLAINGYPWVIGDATDPDSLRSSQDSEDGIFIDPASGYLVLRSGGDDRMVCPGDYIVIGDGFAYPLRKEIFEELYELKYSSPADDTGASDPVEHPSHYTRGSIEVIDFIEDQKLGYHQGNAIKYICRAGFKDPSKFKEDIRKAIFYLNRLL